MWAESTKRYINRNVFSIKCSRPNTKTRGYTIFMSENEGVGQNSFLLVSSNRGGKPMKNKTLFRLTGARRNSLFERTTPLANFRRHKNSSLTSFTRPHFVRVGQQAGMRFASFYSFTQIASQLRIPAKTLYEMPEPNTNMLYGGIAC